MHVLYLHGFTSSPGSSKAAFLAARVAALGMTFGAPDLNQPDFSTLTIGRMIGRVEGIVDDTSGPVTLIGSSLGGFVGVEVASRRPDRVARLVLLAPALGFSGNRMRELGDRGVGEWKASDTLQVFHHAYGRLVPVHYELYADAQRYDPFNAELMMPVQVFQGRHDTAVDPEAVERWAAARPNVELHMLDDDHQLHASLEHIWEEIRRFICA
jgi:pimeloyl-ACP methyl ester carboxylesterase